MERSIILSYNIIGKKSQEIENSNAIRQFEKRINDTQNLIQDHTISTALSNGRSIDQHLQRFGRMHFNGVKGNFLKNPRHWPKLGKTGRLMRSWVLDPNLIYDYLSKHITDPFKPYLPQLKAFIGNLPKIPTHPNMTIGGPALLLTGKSYNSITYKYSKSRDKTSGGLRFHRGIDIHIGSPYISNQFLGRITTKNIKFIKISTDGTTNIFRMSLPFVLAPFFSSLVLTPIKDDNISIQFYNKNQSVPKRNPFYLKKEVADELYNLESNFINTTTDEMLNRGLL